MHKGRSRCRTKLGSTSTGLDRKGLDRKGLQKELITGNFLIRAAHSYAPDIQKLKNYSDGTSQSLADLAQIRCGETVVKIKRQSSAELISLAKQHSLLVVGEPGAGKSGTLHDLYKFLLADAIDTVFLAADRLDSASPGALRNDLGLTHDFVDVLANWPGSQPGVLIIDALDAARAEQSTKVLRDLIHRVTGTGDRWNVIASIRKFDLRYSPGLRQVFDGASHALSAKFVDQEFSTIWHINILELSNEELDQVGYQSPDLYEVIVGTPDALKDLLHVPFNIRLIAELIGGGIAATELTPIQTQDELLTRYWEWRVLGEDRQADARESVLRMICADMVESRRLRAARAAMATADSSALYDLLSSHFVSEWQPEQSPTADRSLIVFSHHVLFDFAVARLLLAGEVQKTTSVFADDPDLCIFIRPSLVFHFQTLWSRDRTRFWELLFSFSVSSKIPEFGRLIGPSVCVELARTFEDVEPLFQAIALQRDTAESTLSYTIGTLLNTSQTALAGPGAGPWSDLLDKLVETSFTNQIAVEMCRLTSAMLARPGCTDVQLEALGGVSRALLTFAWNAPNYQQWLVLQSLSAVCRTYSTDPALSSKLLKRAISLEHLQEHGSVEMPALCAEVHSLVAIDPEFVSQIYRAVFHYKETSDTDVSLGPSQILSLISNRQQDYEMARFLLADAFSALVSAAPLIATGVCIAVVDSHFQEQHVTYSSDEEASFQYQSKEVIVRTDYSSIWDSGHPNDALTILDSWSECLKQLCEASDEEMVLEVVRIVAEENKLAIFWRRLLKIASQFPQSLGRLLLPIAAAPDVLTSCDMSVDAGELVKIIFIDLEDSQRQVIENTILLIKNDQSRARLLSCLPESHLVTVNAKESLAKLRQDTTVPVDVPPFRSGVGGEQGAQNAEEEYLVEQGVPIEAAPNKRIRELEALVREFSDTDLNDTSLHHAVVKIVPHLRELHNAISTADADGVHPKQRDNSSGVLFAAAKRAAKCDDLECGTVAGAFVRKLLLEGSVHEIPIYDPECHPHFDNHISWGGGLPRIESARGLTILATHESCIDEELLNRLKGLSDDPVPAVRYQIAIHLANLYRTARDEMWSLLEHFTVEEDSTGVIRGLAAPLNRLAGPHGDRVAESTARIFERTAGGDGADAVKEMCISLLSGLYIWQDQPVAGKVIKVVASDPVSRSTEIRHLLHSIRGGLTARPHDGYCAIDVRRRTVDLFLEIISSSRSQAEALVKKSEESPTVWSEGDQENLTQAFLVLDRAGSQIYFASGALNQSEASKQLDKEGREQLYKDSKPIIEALADVGRASLTHHLVQTLETFIPCAPHEVFLITRRILRSGEKWGYQYESLAVGTFVRLMERFLAEYRFLFQDNSDCREALVEMLDIFVRAGWPQAQRLTYRLEEIYR